MPGWQSDLQKTLTLLLRIKAQVLFNAAVTLKLLSFPLWSFQLGKCWS